MIGFRDSFLRAKDLTDWTHYELGDHLLVAYKVFVVDLLGRLCSCSMFADKRVYPFGTRGVTEVCENYFPDLTTRCVPAIYAAPDLETAEKYVTMYRESSRFMDAVNERIVLTEYSDGGVARGLHVSDDELERMGTDREKAFPEMSEWTVVGRPGRYAIAEVLMGGRISKQWTRVAAEKMRIWKIL